VEVIRFAASFAQDHGALDVLVNNAGEMIEKGRANETDGLTSHLWLDLTFATNSLGPYMLTVGLLPLLKASQNKPRVVRKFTLMTTQAIHFDVFLLHWFAFCCQYLRMHVCVFACSCQYNNLPSKINAKTTWTYL